MQSLKSIGNSAATDFSVGLAEFISDQTALGRWRRDLARVAAQPFNPFDWEMAGQGVIVEHADIADAERLVCAMASDIGYAVVHLSIEHVNQDEPFGETAGVSKPTLALVGHQLLEDPDPNGMDDTCQVVPDQLSHQILRGTLASLVRFIDRYPKTHSIILVAIVKSLGNIPEPLRVAGRFDRRLTLPDFPDQVIGEMFLSDVGAHRVSPALANRCAKVGSIIRVTHPDTRRRSILIQSLKRRAWQDHRQLLLEDILELTSVGTGDGDARLSTPSERWPTAVHEAGHALVSWFDSQERKTPAFVCATGLRGAMGIMVPSHDGAEQTTSDDTRRDLDHNIRVSLAGRAAEVLLLGDDAISAAGSESDLRHASVLAANMFGQWGLSPEIDGCHGPASNLSLLSEAPSDLEKVRVADLVREYLRKQYYLSYSILEHNRLLLKRIADELSIRGCLFQDDFERFAIDNRGPQ